MPILRRTGPWTGTSIYALRRRDRAPFLERIFLHVGLEKTGTTTLQAAMAVNRQLLRRYGYVFPEGLSSFPSYHIGLALWAANPDAVSELRHAAGLTSREAYDAFLQSYPSQIARELARSGGHTAILSNEHCSSRLATIAEISKIHQIIAPLARRCRVIIYLRRQDELAASHYSTAVRSGATYEFNFPKEIIWFDYLKLLEMWAQVFGKENLSVRVFEPQQLKDRDLLADFFSTIGFTRYDELRRPRDQNRSFDRYVLEFLRRFNAHLSICAESGADCDRRRVEEALAAITTRECLRPNAEAATAFLSQFAASNAEVARRFLNRKDGVLFAGAPLDDQPARLPTLDVDQAVAIAVALWQWQEAKLRATLRNDRSVSRRSALTPLIPLIFRNRCGRL
jgi:hypothetical protein